MKIRKDESRPEIDHSSVVTETARIKYSPYLNWASAKSELRSFSTYFRTESAPCLNKA